MNTESESDYQAIQQLLTRYCYAVDDRDWKTFRQLFTAQALLDYSAFGGPAGGVNEIATFLENSVSGLASSQHTISTMLLDLEGDKAKARTAGLVMLVNTPERGESQVSFIGLWYHDSLVKTPDGWRIAERVQKYGWVHNRPV